jgi:diketogulonate reductase-like aldo/keto reductase
LDLYYLHWWSDDHPLEDTMRAMAELVDAKKVRFVGVSNFDVQELEAAKLALGRHRLAANQVLYHLGERGIESEVLPWCKKNGVAVVGYSPFGSGDFPGPKTPQGKVLAEVAAKVQRTPRQVALAFLSRDPSVFLIPKAEKADHVRDNAGGAFPLPKDAVAAIDQAFPMKPGLSFL